MKQCNCIGPQNSEPLCPCMMRGVQVINDRYIMPARDLGPVTKSRSERDKDALRRILAYARTLPDWDD